ncbi:MAG TPA: flagellar basal-body rod protein FlgG [Oleiagrimonas sp.]|nr:flagellar basal-body rod protein FlgG [Oleiagrimonas sp.]
MMKALWTAKTGLEAQQTRMDVIANNLANVSTNGFKKSRAVFQDLLYQNVRQAGGRNNIQDALPTGLELGSGVRLAATERIHTQGSLEHTGNSKDVAINGRGFFRVLLPNGDYAYTRDGSFAVDKNGQMVNASGYPLQPAIMIPRDALSITIGKDGTVSVTEPGNNQAVQVGQLSLSTFVNPAGLQSMGGNLYLATSASGMRNESIPGMNGAGRLNQSYVETSNVNVVEAMVNMIQTQRAYEINSKAVKSSDEMLARLSRL